MVCDDIFEADDKEKKGGRDDDVALCDRRRLSVVLRYVQYLHRLQNFESMLSVTC